MLPIHTGYGPFAWQDQSLWPKVGKSGVKAVSFLTHGMYSLQVDSRSSIYMYQSKSQEHWSNQHSFGFQKCSYNRRSFHNISYLFQLTVVIIQFIYNYPKDPESKYLISYYFLISGWIGGTFMQD